MPTPARNRDHLTRPTLVVICLCVLVAQSMVAAINLMIPQLAASTLAPTSGQLLWAVDAYVIAFAGLLIPAGACGDRYGRRRALLAGLALFALGAAVSALAGDPAVLIAGRAASGAGAALIMPATMAILVQLAGPEGRVQALASWTLALGLGGLAGNLGGGLVAQYLPWQALFWLMPPIAAVLVLAVLRTVPALPGQPAAAPDPIGAVLLTAGVTVLLHGVIESPAHGWTSAGVLSALALGALLLAGFTRHALRSAHPLVDPRLFAARRLRAAVLGSATSFFGLFALFYVNSQYLQYVKGYSAVLTGVAIVPLTVGMALVPRIAVRLQARSGPRPLIGGGLALIGAGLLAASTADAATPYPLYAVWLLVISVGMGLSAPALAFGVVSELPPGQAGLGSGLNTAARELGAATGVAVVGTVLTGRFAGRPADLIGAAGGSRVAEYAAASGAGLRVVGVLVLVAAATVWFGLRGGPAELPGTPAPEPARKTLV
ncbi:MFS transporter [Kitasatospora camelliae]|uniref:MFS transporter n=1 Tax=Kitasatospora camelliae TaxID=3156397 RepID=A0AAU8JXB1_9ACTN